MLLCTIHIFSQTYNEVITDGDNLMNRGKYVEALKKYDAAEALDPTKKNEVKIKRDKLFNKISTVGRSASNASVEIKKLLDTIQNQKETVKMALELASANITKAQKYINGLNLGRGNLALVNKPDRSNNNKYGFINKNGDLVIDNKYDDANPFDYTGFARVSRINYSGSIWSEITYLVDTAGHEYKSAYQIDNLKSGITALDLRDSIFNRLPLEIFSQSELKVFLLQGNLQTPLSLPGEIKNIQNLESFSSIGYILESLPSEIGLLSKLRTLQLSYCQLNNLPPDIVKLERLQVLDLSSNAMNAFPSEVFSMLQLQSLNLASNGFENIPEQISNLEKLITLDLNWNKLKTLPKQFGNLRKLQYLNLDKNLLNTLPTEIGNLKDLQELILSGNQFESFPMQILTMTNLELLDMSSNRALKTIPAEISKLKNLRSLKLINTSIPISEQNKIRNLLPWCYIIFK